MTRKLEKSDRNRNEDKIIKIAEFLNIDPDCLLTLWLADKVESANDDGVNLVSNVMNIVRDKRINKRNNNNQ